MNKKLLGAVGLTVLLASCSGMRKTENTFSTHAESIRILGYSIPEDDQVAARKLVPENGKIEFINSSPADWSSVLGVLGNIFWIGGTQIGGKLSMGDAHCGCGDKGGCGAHGEGEPHSCGAAK